MAIDHDQIFKRLIEAFFREFMELFCAAEAQLIDFSNVEFLREEHFTDVNDGLHRRLDLVAKVALKTGDEKFVQARIIHVGCVKSALFMWCVAQVVSLAAQSVPCETIDLPT